VFLVRAGDVVLLPLIAGSADKRIGLARRTTDQDGVAAALLADLVDASVETLLGIFLSQFQLPGLIPRLRPFPRIFRRPVRLITAPRQEVLVLVRQRAIELAQEAS